MLSLAEASRVLGVGPEQVRRYLHRGLLPAAKIANAWVLPAAEVHALAEAPPRGGRPLSQAAAWRNILGGSVDFGRPGRSRTRRRARRPARDGIVAGPFTVACIQTNTGNDLAANLTAALALAREARNAGADLIALPEVVSLIEPDRDALVAQAQDENGHEALAAFAAFASSAGVWMLVGSLTVGLGGGRLANRSFLLDPEGRTAARYDKIHLFDVDLPDGKSARESDRYEAGAAAVVAALPWGGLGMTVCYDLRFPVLYWKLAQAGADFLAVPSAFTRTTGCAHWHTLLRARAIETGCYVIAPAQCGDHPGGRASFGHSLVVEPWGEIVADGGEEVGFVLAGIDPARVREARAALPALRNARRYDPPSSLRAAE